MNKKPLVVILVGLMGLGAVFFSACGSGTTNTSSPIVKVPDGTFPSDISGYKMSGPPTSGTDAKDASVTFYSAGYTNGGKKVKYTLYVLPSAAAAKESFDQIRDSSLETYSAVYSDTRRVHYHAVDNGVDTQLLADKNIVTLVADDVNDSLEFEAALPYAAYGMAIPPKHTLAEAREQPRQGLELLAEFRKDPVAFKTKHDGKSILVAGKVTVTSKSAEGGTTVAMRPLDYGKDAFNFLSVVFGPKNRLADKLKGGDIVLCRGKIDADTDLKVLFINDCVMP